MTQPTNEFVELILAQVWQLTLLIFLVLLLNRLLFRHRAHLAHLLWMLVFIKALTPPVWSSPTSPFSWFQSSPSLRAEYGYVAPAPSPVKPNSTGSSLAQKEASGSTRIPDNRKSISIAITCLGVWATGVCLLLYWSLRRWLEVRYLLRTESHAAPDELQDYTGRLCTLLGVRSLVKLVVSRTNLGPMVCGVYHPVLVLPDAMTQSMSPQQLQAIVCHELLHIRRGDTAFSAVQFIAQVVWWFHPLVWLASREANRACEQCCDEEVIANIQCHPAFYARCLLDTLELSGTINAFHFQPAIRSAAITSNRMENIMRNSDRFRPCAPRTHWGIAILLAFVLLPGAGLAIGSGDGGATASAAPPSELERLKHDATKAVAAQQWKLATGKLRAITRLNDKDARAWFMLGYSLHAAGRLDDAIIVHRRAAEFPAVKRTALYNLACAHALRGDQERALESLQQAIDAGFIARTSIRQDPDLGMLKDDPRFLKLVELSKPFAERDVYRQFDFWVGKWNVIGRNGHKVGSNVITKDEKGFLLTEKWTNSTGGTGTSINYYDPSDSKWKQTWVDAGGNVVSYEGVFVDGEMRLEGRLAKPNREIEWRRVSYKLNDDGTVRQFIEQSKDNGQTWSVYFDGRYVRQEETSVPRS